MRFNVVHGIGINCRGIVLFCKKSIIAGQDQGSRSKNRKNETRKKQT